MKQCPVCSESFPDELRFCDIDGTRLTRKQEAGESRGSSRLWSLLGAGLLVGGLVITGAAIVFFPKTRSGPAQPIQGSSETPSAASSAKSNESAPKEPATEVAANSHSTDAKPADAPSAQDASPIQPRKKDTAAVASGDPTAATPNPKAAVRTDGEAENAASKEPERPETKSAAGSAESPAAKPAGPAASSESNAKADQTANEAKKDPKRAAAKSSDKEPNANKKDEKKGGFFRAFKKIFGKS